MNAASDSEGDAHTDRQTPAATLTTASNRRALLESNGWKTLDDLFRLANDESLSKPGLPRWRERLRVSLVDSAGKSVEVYVKRFRDIPLSRQFDRFWGSDPHHGTAWTEWYWLGELARAGIRAAEPIAYGEEMIGPWERRSAIVMGAVDGISLERWCAEHDDPLPSPVLEALADLVARFHALGIAHRDLYLSHVFADAPDADAPRLSLIDLQRIVRIGHRRRRWIVKDLAALNYSTPPAAVSPRNRLRWLKRYLQLRGECEPGANRMAKSSSDREPARAKALGSLGETPFARLRRWDRVLVRWIVGKTERMRRHDTRRRRNTQEGMES